MLHTSKLLVKKYSGQIFYRSELTLPRLACLTCFIVNKRFSLASTRNYFYSIKHFLRFINVTLLKLNSDVWIHFQRRFRDRFSHTVWSSYAVIAQTLSLVAFLWTTLLTTVGTCGTCTAQQNKIQQIIKVYYYW